jgi:hypothetical protein
MDKQLRMEISEAILRRAVIENHERELAAMPSNEELEAMYPLSLSHERRMRKLFRRAHRQEVIAYVAHYARRIAAIFLFGVVIFFGALMTNPEVQAAVRETIISWQERFALFRFRGDSVIQNVQWNLSFVPSGFEEVSRTEHEFGGDIFYLHYDGRHIIFDFSRADQMTRAISIDYTELSIVIMESIEYNIFIPIEGSDHPVSVLWSAHDHVFLLVGDLDPEELLQIALSVIIMSND